MFIKRITIKGNFNGWTEFQVNIEFTIYQTKIVDYFLFRRWKAFDDDSFIGVMANCVWQLKQTDDVLKYRILGELKTKDDIKYYNQVRIKVSVPKKLKKSISDNQHLHSTEYYESLLRAYFRLDTNLTECYEKWSLAHHHFASEAGKFYAIRVLDQDPVENLFSFICSQNNHITR